MFIALYQMKVKPGLEPEFEKAWAKWTDALHRCKGSLGSRLHKTDKEFIYIAYAQWPSREVYMAENGNINFSPKDLEARDWMADTLESLETLHLMEVYADHLKDSIFPRLQSNK